MKCIAWLVTQRGLEVIKVTLVLNSQLINYGIFIWKERHWFLCAAMAQSFRLFNPTMACVVRSHG